MDITFACDGCRQNIVIDEAAAGSVVDCPKCRARVLVPDKSTPTTPRRAEPQTVIVERIRHLPLAVETPPEAPLQVEIVGFRVSWRDAWDTTAKMFFCALLLSIFVAVVAAILTEWFRSQS
jgi:DNA-directed RNA polymerase subunit RPC12/RpoP